MAGYSYFSYDQMTLLGIEVHSDELELLQQAADMYDWEIMETEVEPKFKEAALNFRDGKHSFACPRKDELDEDLQESFPFLDEMAETEEVASDRNPKGAGRRGQDFISYLKAFLLAPVLRVEQNSEAIAAALAGNPAFYVACGFTHHPASRTLRYFDQIMCGYSLWDLVHDIAYKKNVDDKLIDESEEHILNIDNTHLFGYSTPGKYVKECRECDLYEDCEDKVSTDASADWYVKGKYKYYYAHQIGMLQLADSGAPVGCVVLNGKQYEPDSLEPLLKDLSEKHPDLDIEKVNADGIFNSQPCRDKVQEILGEDVELFSSVNARRKKDIETPARGIAKITKHGNVQCIASHNMVFLSKDYSMDAYIFGCPVLNEEARKKLEHMEMEVPEQIKEKAPVKVIYETDMCLDVDDVGALATLHALADKNEVQILAVCFNEVHKDGAAAISAINTWYHRGDIPIGIYKKPLLDPDESRYLSHVARFPNGVPDNLDLVPDALDVYVETLESQPDSSVTIVSVGFLNNLADLLESKSELVAKKVKELVIMGARQNDPFNLFRHGTVEAAEKVFRDWPTSIVISQPGGNVRTGESLKDTPAQNPVREAYYRYFEESFKGRSSWDQIAVLYAVRGLSYFSLESEGAGKLRNGYPIPMKPGWRSYIITKLSSEEYEQILNRLMTKPPEAGE